MFDKVAKEIKNLEEPVLIVCDSDQDGITSGILMKVILKKLNKKYDIIVRNHGKLSYEDLMKIKKKYNDFNSFVLLDSPYPDNALIELAKEKKVIYIDHHKREVPKNIPNNLIYFDVRALNLEIISTAGMVYRIGKKFFKDEFKKYSLIAAIGAIGDYMFEQDEILKKDFKETYPSLYLDTSFSPTFLYIFSYFLFGNPKYLVEKGEKLLEDLQDFFSKDLMKGCLKGIKKLTKAFSKLKLIYSSEKLEVYKSIMSSYPANLISSLKPDKIIIVVSPAKENLFERFLSKLGIVKKYKLSIRRKNIDVDVGKLISEFTEKYGIQGGGHPEAAGGLIYAKNLDKLIKFIEEKL